ncbi:unnamed protein product [Lasius platythorax]|uniref:Uncharacterized protein n=1 Tax=Lasius platythorax TaxID=488582 RepID=A0AAV2NEV9_9HYME
MRRPDSTDRFRTIMPISIDSRKRSPTGPIKKSTDLCKRSAFYWKTQPDTGHSTIIAGIIDCRAKQEARKCPVINVIDCDYSLVILFLYSIILLPRAGKSSGDYLEKKIDKQRLQLHSYNPLFVILLP